ncbi:MAG TPA: hypothetical protein VEZ46_14580 [Mycobacteriales bacterium]|nr:hypothetical protein [Mycobacteriales bacterium]
MRRLAVPAVSAAAVLAVVVGAAALQQSGGPGAQRRPLPPLQLGSGAGSGEGAAARADTGPLPVDAPGIGYVVRGELPGAPERPVRAYRVRRGTATREQVARLAEALGVPGQPKLGDGGWVVVGGGRTLTVAQGPGMPWNLMLGEQSCLAARSDGPDIACAGREHPGVAADPATCPVEPARPVEPDPSVESPAGPKCPEPKQPPMPSEARAREVALAVLGATGTSTDGAAIQLHEGWGTRMVSVEPRVDGVVVAGWQSMLSIDAQGAVQGANGWLGAAVAADRYPVISADAAVDRLQRVGRIFPAICEPRTDGKEGCQPPPPAVVTGASLGLMFTMPYGDDDAFLLPAWLFDVRGDAAPTPVVALPDELLPKEPKPAEPKPDEPKPAEPTGEAPPPAGCAPDEPVSSDGGVDLSTVPRLKCAPGAAGGGAPEPASR